MRTLVLALYDEAALTAAAKGLTGLLGEQAAVREAASLASGPARRAVSEEEVLRIVLAARRIRRLSGAPAGDARPVLVNLLPATAAAPVVAAKPRRGRLAVWAMRSLARHPSSALV
ncbi:hypothetical protein [Azospirillum sp. TSO35-2]|uniref:hypothetical protein n=1 Tax=Azospirillum sp. TSO35-2 TaxID=716796 RepID=UPI001FFF3566|nr:hypothetical protein [Azospirillum sp. TSO35-2]